MSGLIPDSFIEELLARSDVVELIERRVPLKRVGSEFHACCPFHDEKTPSFTVSPRKQFYHCFGCGAHGSAIGFLMQYEGLEFLDAIEEMARAAGLEVPSTGSEQPRPDTGLYDMLAACAKFYTEELKKSPAAIEYLKGRGLSGEVTRDFEIGYAPSGWDGLIRKLGTDTVRLEQLKKAGMLSEGKSGSYDKFRDRIMFPIHDRRGRVIAFGGRALSDDGPKYLNSPETALYHKSRELYGLYLARQRSGRLDDIIDSTVRNFITSYNLIETVRRTNRELVAVESGADQVTETSALGEVSLGRGGITRGILEQAQPKVKQFGILLIDVKIKRLNYTEKVRQSVYGRMIKEREQKAEEYRSEGQGEARKIEGGVEKELKQITSEAYRTAQEKKGKVDKKS